MKKDFALILKMDLKELRKKQWVEIVQTLDKELKSLREDAIKELEKAIR